MTPESACQENVYVGPNTFSWLSPVTRYIRALFPLDETDSRWIGIQQLVQSCRSKPDDLTFGNARHQVEFDISRVRACSRSIR